MFPPLAGNPTVAADDASTLLHITLTGWKTAETQAYSRVYTMPGFARLNDAEIAEILTFVRSNWGNAGAAVAPAAVKAARATLDVITSYSIHYTKLYEALPVDRFSFSNTKHPGCNRFLFVIDFRPGQTDWKKGQVFCHHSFRILVCKDNT